jgi:hemoglobin
MNQGSTETASRLKVKTFILACCLLPVALGPLGCSSQKSAKPKEGFFTSGSREADQRADQRMTQQEQLSSTGQSAGEKKKEKNHTDEGTGQKVATKRTLYERLGGDQGLTAIVNDFVPRAMEDPRVNWNRQGVVRGSLFHHKQAPVWNATPQAVAALKKHLIEFFALSTGGPVHYEGREIKTVHDGMHIANPEFDAAVGDLKASLDKLQVPTTEQKELLAILESTRAQIVTER